MATIKPESFNGKTYYVLYVNGAACLRFVFMTEAIMAAIDLGLEVVEQ